MARGTTVDRRLAAGVVLGHVRRYLQVAQVFHEVIRVIVLVTAQRYSAPPMTSLKNSVEVAEKMEGRSKNRFPHDITPPSEYDNYL
jgi:hypothetical protein